MDNIIKGSPARTARCGGFSLIEIVVALTIVSVIAAVAIPSLKGLNQSEQAREPVRALAELVQEVRLRAVREGRPYQIVFERGGMHAMAGSRPFNHRAELLEHLEELRRPPVITTTSRQEVATSEVAREAPSSAPMAGTSGFRPMSAPLPESPAAEPTVPEIPWSESIPLALKTGCAVLLWGDPEWDTMEGEKLRTWVFQPTGMSSPARVRLQDADLELEAAFDPLTGELTAESSRPITATASL